MARLGAGNFFEEIYKENSNFLGLLTAVVLMISGQAIAAEVWNCARNGDTNSGHVIDTSTAQIVTGGYGPTTYETGAVGYIVEKPTEDRILFSATFEQHYPIGSDELIAGSKTLGIRERFALVRLSDDQAELIKVVDVFGDDGMALKLDNKYWQEMAPDGQYPGFWFFSCEKGSK